MRQRYIQSFNTTGDEQSAIDDKLLGKPYVALIHDGAYIDWNSKETDYRKVPLTFEIISGGTIGFTSPIGVTIEYSADNGQTWGAFSNIEVEAGDKIMFRGTRRTATGGSNDKASNFTATNGAKFNIVGNINSLLNKTNYTGITNLSSYGQYTFLHLFAGLNGLVSAENLVLPATTLALSCYKWMFQGCTNLTKAPTTLPATTLVQYCYQNMFDGCTSLTTAPVLPATTLIQSCYESMFNGCKSLTTAPELPATTLKQSCYESMFQGCTSLNYIKCRATDISAKYCTFWWVKGVASSGTFVKNANMSSWARGTSGIPNGWTVIDADN